VLYGLALGILILDLLTKFFLERWLPPAGLSLVPGLLNLVRVRNPGVAFGLFRDWGWMGLWVWSLLGLAAGGLILYLGRTEKDKGRRVALGMIAGGALGNAVDRILHGAVFDFVDLHWGAYHWPAFNLADAAITLGVGVYLLRLRS